MAEDKQRKGDADAPAPAATAVVIPPVCQHITRLLALLAGDLSISDAQWMQDPANRQAIEQLRALLGVRQLRRIASFAKGTTFVDVMDGVNALLAKTPPPQPMGKDTRAKLFPLALHITDHPPAGPLSLANADAVKRLALPDYVMNAVHANARAIAWNTPNGEPADTWEMHTWLSEATTPSYDARRQELWRRVVAWSAAHGRIDLPESARDTLLVCGVTATKQGGGAALDVKYCTWAYGAREPTDAPGFLAPVPAKELNVELLSGAQRGYSRKKDKIPSIYYIYLEPGDTPPDVAGVDRVQVYVGETVTNIRFRVYDTTGHWGAIKRLAVMASQGGPAMVPDGYLFVDIALLWVAINNGYSWAGRAAVVAAKNVPIEQYPGLEREHVRLRHAHDMHFGMNGTVGN